MLHLFRVIRLAVLRLQVDRCWRFRQRQESIEAPQRYLQLAHGFNAANEVGGHVQLRQPQQRKRVGDGWHIQVLAQCMCLSGQIVPL